MKFIADLHFHSKYSRAVSPQMELRNLNLWGKKKGIDILTTTDFTHPLWVKEIENNLKEVREGIYRLKKNGSGSYFILTTEISLIFSQHKAHIIMLAPNIEVAKKINKKLTDKGFNLGSDGRPILGISVHDFVSMVKEIDPRINFIFAHIWTPWFSLYGSRSGFNSIKECLGNLENKVMAIETGLSSDPLMNWQIEELDKRVILSFSDSHSLKNLGRNASILELPKNFTYSDIITAITTPYKKAKEKNLPHVSMTIEFYPQEGKYHFTGHRKCNIVHSPEDSQKLGVVCPVCGRSLTVGVMHQVQKLSRKQEIVPVIKNINELKVFYHPTEVHHPFVNLVPLREIIAEVEQVGDMSKKVQDKYHKAVDSLGGELNILLKTPLKDIEKILGEKVAEGIDKNRKGKLIVEPGYDGIYGKVKIWGKKKKEVDKQMSLY